MRCQDGPANCQPHTHTPFLRTVKSLDRFFRVRKPSTVIPDLHNNRVSVLQFRADMKYFWTILDRLHGLNSIHEQIKDNLLELHAIALCDREPFFQIDLDDDSMLHGFPADHTNHFVDHFIDVDIYPCDSSFLEECPNAPYYLTRVFAIANDPFRCGFCIGDIWWIRGQPLRTSLTIHYYSAQRL